MAPYAGDDHDDYSRNSSSGSTWKRKLSPKSANPNNPKKALLVHNPKWRHQDEEHIAVAAVYYYDTVYKIYLVRFNRHSHTGVDRLFVDVYDSPNK